jgi:hypothetical protein
VIVSVPMHRLSRQIVARFAERFLKGGITTAVYEGRGVSHREGPLDEETATAALADARMPLCRNPLEVKLALKACADVTQAVCGTKKRTAGRSAATEAIANTGASSTSAQKPTWFFLLTTSFSRSPITLKGCLPMSARSLSTKIYDASIIQAIGRARGLNRTAANPVEIHVFANCPLPFPVASIDRWRRPSRLQKMLWRGIVPFSAAGMAKRYPELFRTPEAARTAKHRWGGEAGMLDTLLPLAESLPFPTALVTLQPSGRKPVRMLVSREHVGTVHAEALAQFGSLASWHVESFSHGRPAPRPAVGNRYTSAKSINFAEMSRSPTPLRGSPASATAATSPRGPPG